MVVDEVCVGSGGGVVCVWSACVWVRMAGVFEEAEQSLFELNSLAGSLGTTKSAEHQEKQ